MSAINPFNELVLVVNKDRFTIACDICGWESERAGDEKVPVGTFYDLWSEHLQIAHDFSPPPGPCDEKLANVPCSLPMDHSEDHLFKVARV